MLAAGLSSKRNATTAFLGGAVIGALGGLIGLGGAEFRLPLLIGAFGFPALQAVILNKAMSLIVVASALPFRAAAVPFASVAAHWSIIVNLLAGSLLGAWFGAGWATKLASQTLYRVDRDHAGVDRGHSAARPSKGKLRRGSDRSGAIGGWRRGGLRHWRCRRAARGGGRRVVDPYARSPFRRGYRSSPGVCRSLSACRRCSSASRGTVRTAALRFSVKIAVSCWSWQLAQSLGASSAVNCSASFRRPHLLPATSADSHALGRSRSGDTNKGHFAGD